MRFIQTAVARENLEEAWTLVGPNLRGGLTQEGVDQGGEPGRPVPDRQARGRAVQGRRVVRDERAARGRAAARKGSGVRAQIFFLELKQVGTGPARWVVDNWVPRASAVVPR